MKFNDESKQTLIMLGEIIAIAMVAYFSYAIFPHNSVILFLIISACILVVSFRVTGYMQKNALQRKMSEVSEAVKILEDDISAKIVTADKDLELEMVYSGLERLRDSVLKRENYRQEIFRMLNTIATNVELEKMLETIMPQIVEGTNSSCSAFYLANQVSNKLEIKHSIGFSKNIYGEFDLNLGEGLVGIYKSSRDIRVMRDIPEDTVYLIRSFLGKIKPKCIMSVPIVNQDQMLAILVLASVNEYTQEDIETMDLMKYYLGVAVFNGINFERNKRLASELKFQNKLIQDLNNELESRVQDRTTFLNDVIDSITDYAIYALDTDGVILAWNKGAENIMGFAAEDVVGKAVDIVYRDDPMSVEKARKRMDEAAKAGKYTESGWRVKQDGTSYYAEMSVFTRYGINKNVIGFTIIIKDITAFKKAESALWVEREFSSKIMEGSQKALLLLDEDATIIMANTNAREIFRSMDAVGRSFYSYFKNEKNLRNNFDSVFESGLALDDLEVTLRHSGEVINMNISLIGDSTISVQMLFVMID